MPTDHSSLWELLVFWALFIVVFGGGLALWRALRPARGWARHHVGHGFSDKQRTAH